MAGQFDVHAAECTVRVSHDLGFPFEHYLRRYYFPFYRVTPATPTSQPLATFRISSSPDEFGAWSLRPGVELGRVSLSLAMCGWAFQHGPRLRSVRSESVDLILIADSATRQLTAVAPNPSPATLRLLTAHIDVLSISILVQDFGHVPIHAAAVKIDDRGVLITGDKGAGKTSLSLALVKERGAHWISNDVVLLSLRDGALVMQGTPIPLRIGAGTLLRFPQLRDALDPVLASDILLRAPEWGSEAKTELSVGTMLSGLGISWANTVPVTDVIWPGLAVGERPTLEELPRDRDMHLLDDALYCPEPHWMTWARLGFGGVDPLTPEMREVLAAARLVRHWRMWGAKNVDAALELLLSSLRDSATRIGSDG